MEDELVYHGDYANLVLVREELLSDPKFDGSIEVRSLGEDEARDPSKLPGSPWAEIVIAFSAGAGGKVAELAVQAVKDAIQRARRRGNVRASVENKGNTGDPPPSNPS